MMENKPAKKYRDIMEEVEDLRASGPDNESQIESMLEAIKDFCQECPLYGALSNCSECYLEPWKEKAKEL